MFLNFAELLHYRNSPSSTPLIATVAIDGNGLKATRKTGKTALTLSYFLHYHYFLRFFSTTKGKIGKT